MDFVFLTLFKALYFWAQFCSRQTQRNTDVLRITTHTHTHTHTHQQKHTHTHTHTHKHIMSSFIRSQINALHESWQAQIWCMNTVERVWWMLNPWKPVCSYVWVCVYACARACVLYICVCVCVCVWVWERESVCVCVCVCYICVCVSDGASVCVCML